MNNSTKLLLTGIFLLALASRLLIAFSTPHLNYDAYATVRQVENILQTGTPLINDPLSYGGRTHAFSPVYYYFLSLFSLLMPIELALKIIPNILAALTVIIIYYIAYKLSESEKVSLVASVFAATIPIFFNNTINNASIYSAVIPLMLLSIYYFILTNKESKHIYKLITCLVLLTLTHPSSLILTASMLIYIVLVKVQGFRESLREPEIVLFYIFFAIWVNMIIYKKALTMHGSSVIWQNMPQAVLAISFTQATFLEAIYSIGILPLIAGMASIYISLFRSKNKIITMLMSVGIITFIMLMFRLVELKTGLMFLGVTLAALSAYSLRYLYDFTKQMKFQSSTAIIFLAILAISLLTFIPNVSIASGAAKLTPSQADIDAFTWIRDNTPKDSSVLVPTEEGSAMSYYANRKNIIDDDYVLINNIDTRYSDIQSIYKERFLTSALDTLNYYSTDYIVVTEHASKQFNITRLLFADDRCITKAYPEDYSESIPTIYSVRCVLSTQ